MKRITVDGTKYTRTTHCWIQYEDGKSGTLYMGDEAIPTPNLLASPVLLPKRLYWAFLQLYAVL